MKPSVVCLAAVGRRAARATCALVLVASAASAVPAIAVAPAESPASVAVYLTPPTITAGSPLSVSNSVFTATAPASAGATVAEIDLQESPAGVSQWATVTCFTTAANPYSETDPDLYCQGTQTGSTYSLPYTAQLPDGTQLPDGEYDFRAVALDGTGALLATSAVVRDLSSVFNSSYVWLANPGSPLSGTVDLTAQVAAGNNVPDTITFAACPTSDDCEQDPGRWQTLSTEAPVLDAAGDANAQYELDTTTLPDGTYDLAASAEDAAGDAFTGSVVGQVVIDNSPPAVTLDDPGASLSGTVNLTASAQDSGSGVDSVKFEVAPAGTGNWTGVGAAGSPPYSASVDTRQFADGSYDIRAVATDNAGNSAASTVTGVGIANPGAERFGGLTITDYATPTTANFLLGELPGDEHETWALGRTDAPPPTIAGVQLPYTAAGDGQEVLVRYTDDTGWQVADVLRNPDGTAFPLYPGGNVEVIGQMTASGEAWIALYDSLSTGGSTETEIGVFHRLPGGPFELDPAATAALRPLLKFGVSAATMRLAQAPDGSVYGVLVQRQSAPQTDVNNVPSADGPTALTTELDYGQLVDGVWTMQNPALPSTYTAPAGVNLLQLDAADVTGPGSGWAAISQDGLSGGPVILAEFAPSGWTFLPEAGLDALDLSGPFGPDSPESEAAGGAPTITPTGLRADADGVWLSATVSSSSGTKLGDVVARYDDASARVVSSWCAATVPALGCSNPLDPPDEPAAVPDAVFDTPQGVVADALASDPNDDFVDVYDDGAWTPIASPGIGNYPTSQGAAVFADPTDGWLAGAGTDSLGMVSATPPPSLLASWPEANRNPLLAVALPPGNSTTDTGGALAVGLDGTALHYDPSAGWQVDPTPPQAQHVELTGVAFAGPALAFAVGQDGTILRWNGTSWAADPQSLQLTNATLNAVAFGSDGQGWAVGSRGAILHYDGTAWSAEQIDSEDSGADVTSVTVAGQDAYALADGNLLVGTPDGTWQRVAATSLPTPAPPTGSLTLVSGLPDGGLAVAGRSLLMLRQSASADFEYAPESFQGIPVALAAFRDSAGDLRTFISVAPPITAVDGALTDNVGGYPAGDGDLLVQTDGGFEDLSHELPAAQFSSAPGDGFVQPDPVLAVAASPDGSHAWAVGGYAGTHAADGIGTDQVLSSRDPGWFTSAIWRFDIGGSATSPLTSQATVDLPATPNTVSFAFFSSALCKESCTQVQDAQPDVNLNSAATEIAAFAQQPGGPAFAMLGGNAQGSMFTGTGSDPFDLAQLPQILAPLAGLPTYAAYGPLDGVPTDPEPALPWAQAFANAPAPFGPSAAPAGISPQGAGDPTGLVNKYYAFDVAQNGGTLRVIVLDNSAGSLEASAPGQTAWLANQLSQAQSEGVPIVVFAAEPLNDNDQGAASDGDAVAAQLAAAGVLAVFTTSGGVPTDYQSQPDQVVEVPANAAPGAPQIPEYEGATLTYQQNQNNGVLWYDVSVNTASDTVSVQGIPVISSLAIDPIDGLIAARSATLSFQAIGRRPASTIATTPFDPSFPGYDQYVNIPASTCSSCIGPSYTFTSSNTIVGDFVVPSAPGSPYPKLNTDGKTTHSSTSGLFCAFNSGTTTVTVTSGLLSASVPVTVQAGGYGPPCGTVAGGTSDRVIAIPGATIVRQAAASGLGGPVAPTSSPPASTPAKITFKPPPKPAPQIVQVVPHHVAPSPKPAPVVTHKPAPAPARQQPHASPPAVVVIAPAVQPFVQPDVSLSVPPIVPPLIPPALTPVPPGGATAPAQSTAKREEKARKHASQSAYVIRPAGTSATDWFYPAVGVVTLLSVMLIAGGLRPGPDPKLAFVEIRDPVEPRRRR